MTSILTVDFPQSGSDHTLPFPVINRLVLCQKNKVPPTSGPINKHVVSDSSGDLKSKIKVWTELVPSEGSEGEGPILSSLLPDVSGFPCFVYDRFMSKTFLYKGHQPY